MTTASARQQREKRWQEFLARHGGEEAYKRQLKEGGKDWGEERRATRRRRGGRAPTREEVIREEREAADWGSKLGGWKTPTRKMRIQEELEEAQWGAKEPSARGQKCGKGWISPRLKCRVDALDAAIDRLARLDARVKQAPGQLDLFGGGGKPESKGQPCGQSHIPKAHQCHKNGSGAQPAAAPKAAAATPAAPTAKASPPPEAEKPPEPAKAAYAKPEDLDGGLATRAHAGTSHDPEKRGRSHQEEFARHLNGLHEEMSLLATSPEQKAALEAGMEDYKAGYKQRYTAYLEAKSRTISPMVTGPARFPVERNRKRMETENKRLQELIAYSKRGKTTLIRRLNGVAPQEVKQAEAVSGLKKAIDREVAIVQDIDSGGQWKHLDRRAFTNSLAGKLTRAAARGEVEAIEAALDHLRLAQHGMKRPMFTQRHSIWGLDDTARRMRAKQQEQPAGRPGGDVKPTSDYQSGGIERDAEADRIRIRFNDGKPSESVRTALKRSGWRWSPTNSAWQRMNTLNSLHSAESILRQADEERKGRAA